MMKWGRKKKPSSSTSSSSSSSSHSHLISHLFPLSWLSKSKKNPEKPSSKNHFQRVSSKSPQISTTKFYGHDDVGVWRPSFGDNQENNTKSFVQTIPEHYCGSCKSNSKQVAINKKNKSHEPKEVAKEESLQRTYKRIIKATSELQRELNQVKIGELHLASEKQRKSFHIRPKVRVCSPRTPSKAEICKIKSLENSKKANIKNKMIKEMKVEDKAGDLGSFAMVKCSNNPQEDFRDSMLEMIMEKKITRPEELEELLACYLTLNADEYHDLIIKVFRQVWCELEGDYFNQILPEEHY